MPSSQNGYPANDRALIRSVVIPGTDVKVAVRTGAAGDLLVAAAARWHRDVEPLRAPDGVLDCWGYAERTIRGSSTQLSNHASGTALDFRARAHPLGTEPAANFTPAQITAIRRIVADAGGALRWGGDYSGRKDGMHLEVVAAESACALALFRFTATAHEEDELPLSPDDLTKIRDVVWQAPINDPIGKRSLPAFEQLMWACAHAAFARGGVDSLHADIVQIPDRVAAAVSALVAQRAPASGITTEDIRAAVQGALGGTYRIVPADQEK